MVRGQGGLKMVSMRCPRITVEKGEDGLYHCMSRIVGGDYIFDQVEKEVFIQRMWRLADFLGIAVLDYVVMSNHYHQLLGVPGVVEISDAELLRRVQVYYGENSHRAKVLAKALEKGGDPAQRQRKQYRKRMGNLSEYQKHLKQGFTKWYNRQPLTPRSKRLTMCLSLFFLKIKIKIGSQNRNRTGQRPRPETRFGFRL